MQTGWQTVSTMSSLSDLGGHCLPVPVCPNIEDHYRSLEHYTKQNEPRHDKTNKMTVRPAKTQISLGVRPVWSESSLSAWKNLGSLATHWAHSKDADQTGRMPRLIRVFAGRTAILLVLSCHGSNNKVDRDLFGDSQKTGCVFIANWQQARDNVKT